VRSIIACGLILLGLNGTAHEPEYGALFSERFASVTDTSASSVVQIDSSTSRSDKLTVASLQPRALALEIFRPTAADMQLRLASADPDFNTSLLSTDNRGTEVSLDDLCQALFNSAQDNDIPVQFFANLIWQESRLKADDVSKKGAMGIAQFMPSVAAEKGLDDPFDPLQALPASARLLHELRGEFGNLGLVAAAYNAGPGRVTRWLERRVSLPRETRNYVVRVTGLSVDAWRTMRVSNDALTFVQHLPCRSMPAFANVEQQQEAQTAAKVEQVKLDVSEGKSDDPDITGSLDDMPEPAADAKAAHKSARARDKHDAHRAERKAEHHGGKREVERTPHATPEKRRV
jgi:transglycosylase-like protein with SLT domain